MSRAKVQNILCVIGRLSLKSICALTLLSMAACDRETGPTLPTIHTDQIYSVDGGFIITESMLDMPYNQITFPGTHNSFAGPDWDDNCGNQLLTITEQLQNGIRYIEIDVDEEGCASHNGFCTKPLESLLQEIREYARDHPRQIITVRVSDLACDRRRTLCQTIRRPTEEVNDYCYIFLYCCTQGEPTPRRAYEMMNWFLEDTGLSEYVYNWDASISQNRDLAKCYVPERWPTLREMIGSGKNVMFFHYRDIHDIVDSGYFRGLDFNDYCDAKHYDLYSSYQLADLSKIQSVWDPGLCSRQKEGHDRLFLLECHANTYNACYELGWENCPQSHRSSNDGRRLYQLAKQHEEEMFLLPGDRVVNYIAVDYFMCTEENHGHFKLPINVVDACNRLNYERTRYSWHTCSYAWELEPHELDHSKVEHTQRIPALREEIDEAIRDFQSMDDGLSGHESRGAIVSTLAHRQISRSEEAEGSPTDWLWLPEWAVDNDYYTAWRGIDWGGSLVIDLGRRYPIDEVAIAWKYAHKAPGFMVYASNDAQVMTNPPESSVGWTTQAIRAARYVDPPQMWDIVDLQLYEWRYIKIEVTSPDEFMGSAIFELRVSGPAS